MKRDRYFLGFILSALLLGLPSYFCWQRDPFFITFHEFDFFLGLFTPTDVRSPIQLILLGQIVHISLIAWMSWCYYRIVIQAAKSKAAFTLVDLKSYLPLVVPFFFYLPWLSPDVFFYFGTGWIQSAHHLNPYTTQISQAPDYPDSPIYLNILWCFIITPYGPLFCKFISGLVFLAKGNVIVCLILIKSIYVILHLLNAWLASLIARELKMNEKAVGLCFLLNPALLLGYLGTGHNDILLFSCLLAGVLFLIREKFFICILFLSFGAGIKYVPLIIMPLVFIYILKGSLRPGRLLYVTGLGLLFLLLTVLPSFLFEGGLSNFSRLLVGRDQLVVNFLYIILAAIFVSPGSIDFVTLKMILKSTFVLIYAIILLRLFLKGKIRTTNDLFSSAILMFFFYFVIGSPEIHEWYFCWFASFIFWINHRSFFMIGIILGSCLHSIAIFTGQQMILTNRLGWTLMFFLLWICLIYLLRTGRLPDRKSPLFGFTDPKSPVS